MIVEGLELDPTWLRDRCACPDCRDPHSGQRLFDIAELPEQTATASTAAGGLAVTFADGHRSTFALEDLRAASEPAPWSDVRQEQAKRLWRIPAPPSAHDWSDFREDPLPGLRELALEGYVLLTGVGTRERTVLEVAQAFGFVRTTNYGDLFDVRVEPSPVNLAFTSRGIGPHTDNPYRDPVPTLQLLHCLSNSAQGGESGLVDGFAAAAALREQDPGAFRTLSTTPVGYEYGGLRTHLPIIGLDAVGRIREIRFNNRSMRVPRLPADSGFYPAYRRFAALLNDPGARLRLTLRPGDCLVFDNTRLLHARTAFESNGGRHLQGAYADIDAVLSRLATEEP